MNIRDFVAIAACKSLVNISKMLGKKGSSGPGSIALKISPGLLKRLSSQVKHEIIAVCGTNGKTTTNNLLCELIEGEGNKVICNKVGANMLPGVACCFISMAKLSGKLDCDYACLECDEASLRHIVNHIKPDKIIITNLFRDQMDRYGETEMTAQLLDEAIKKVPDTTLILNADDPLCVKLGKGRKCLYYGIDENCNNETEETREGRYCPECGKELEYEYYHYSQLGKFKCPDCSFHRPQSDYGAKNISLENGMSFDVTFKDKVQNLSLNYRGFYNIYNVLASFCAYESANLSIQSINEVYNNYKPQIGRMETFAINGKTVILNLSKNPAGFNQAISTLVSDKRSKDVILAVNDNPSDGCDISWLWDMDAENLKKANINTIYAGGMRKFDLATRLKYAGFENVIAKENDKETLLELISQSGEICYVLVNYTELFRTQQILKSLEQKED